MARGVEETAANAALEGGARQEAADVLVVGGGPAGLAAAHAARAAGCDTLVVERAFAGGNAVAHSLLPSKIHLRAARHLAEYRSWGPLPVAEPGAYLYAAGIHLRHRREEARTDVERRLAEAGVRWLSGDLRFEAPGRAHVASPFGPTDVMFRAVVIATGSVQHVPSGMPRPDGTRVLIPRDLAAWNAAPATAVIVGAGPTGVELASLLADYGTRVTLVGRGAQILAGEDAVLASLLADALSRRGVTLRLRAEAREADLAPEGRGVRVDVVPVGGGGGERLVADALFLASGRRGDTASLHVERLGLVPDAHGYLRVGPDGATGVPNVFAAGDVTGGPHVANRAFAQGQAAGEAAARAVRPEVGGAPSAVFASDSLPVAVFARPEYARVGTPPPGRPPQGHSIWEAGGGWRDVRVRTPGDGRISGGPGRHAPLLHRFVAQSETAEETPYDRVRVLVDPNGRVLGAAILGEEAAERILVFALALREGIPLDRLRAVMPVVPTAGENLRLIEPGNG